MFQYEAKVLRIIDGDTMILEVDLGFDIRHKIDVRLARINTPEIVNMGATGLVDKATAYVQACCPVGSVCIANISRAEKYGRWLAEIYFSPGEVDRDIILQSPRVLNDELVIGGFAKPYSGGKK